MALLPFIQSLLVVGINFLSVRLLLDVYHDRWSDALILVSHLMILLLQCRTHLTLFG